MYLANIVSTDKEKVSEDFNVVTSLDDIIQGLPTLIIGFDYIKKNHHEYNILDRKLNDNTFWTFRKVEKRELHDSDIFLFSTYVYENIANKVQYFYIDPLQISFKNTKKFLKLFYSANPIVYKFTDESKGHEMLYILINTVIYGVDINFLKYMGFKTNRILNDVKNLAGVFLEGNNIFIEYQKGLEFLDNQVKYVPLLYKAKNG